MANSASQVGFVRTLRLVGTEGAGFFTASFADNC
jgi:hypothetical protein